MNKLREELDGEPLWGLPQHISDELVETHELSGARKLGKWLFIIVMLAGFAIILMLWIFCQKILNQNAIEAAGQIDGFAYDTNFGIGLLIGMFISIFFSGIILSLILRVVPMPIKGAFFLGSHETPPPKTKKKNKKKKIGTIPSPPIFPFVGTIWDDDISTGNAAELINSYSMKVAIKIGMLLSPFILLAAGITYLELGKFTILNAEGIHKTSLFSSKMTMKSWQDAKIVKLGCNHTKDKDTLMYLVVWPDGSDMNLPTNTHINGESWLTNLEAVDKHISQGSAEFVRWRWGIQTPLHPTCLRKFYKQQGDGSKARINRLLRIGELD